MTDFQYRAVHKLTIAGKAITEAHYDVSHEKSYWEGCSTGGRQGLKEAQRCPADCDAIIAGAPANNWSHLMSLSVLIQRNIGPGGIGFDKLGVLEEAAIAACDASDRVTGRAEQVDGGAAKAMDPDLSAFLARGGKLITYHGTARHGTAQQTG